MLLLGGWGSTGYAATVFFQGLGDLGGGSSRAWGISADGTTVVGQSFNGAHTEAFRWTMTNGTMHGLGTLGGAAGDDSIARAVSADGLVVTGVSTNAAGDFEAFHWVATGPAAGTMAGLGDLGGIIPYSYGYGVNAAGDVVVGTSNLIAPEGFRWRDNPPTMTGVGDLPGGPVFSQAFAVSADGNVIVGESKSSRGTEAFVLRPGDIMRTIGFLPGGIYSTARGISADGLTVVGQSGSNDGNQAFCWRDFNGNGRVDLGELFALGDLPGGAFLSEALDVSADGGHIVGWGTNADGQTAAIWGYGGVMGPRAIADVLVNDYGLSLNGWHLLAATGISDDGLTITGYGLVDQGLPSERLEAWVARVPEPLSLTLWGLGVVALRRRVRPRDA